MITPFFRSRLELAEDVSCGKGGQDISRGFRHVNRVFPMFWNRDGIKGTELHPAEVAAKKAAS
jgi:hypothetical protein